MLAEVSNRAGSLARRFMALSAIAIVAAGTGACGDDDDPSGPGGDIAGTWVTDTGEGLVYVEITSSTFAMYQDLGECVISVEYDIVDEDDGVYTLELPGSGINQEVEIDRSGDELVIDGITYESSNVDVDDFELCTAPEVPSCASVPEIEFGFSEIGDLEQGDEIDQVGAFVDWYAIEITSELPDPVVVAVDSEDFDTYLIVYDEDGNEVATNDDYEEETTNSRVDLSEPNGCYLVQVSSFSAGETGGYEVFFF